MVVVQVISRFGVEVFRAWIPTATTEASPNVAIDVARSPEPVLAPSAAQARLPSWSKRARKGSRWLAGTPGSVTVGTPEASTAKTCCPDVVAE